MSACRAGHHRLYMVHIWHPYYGSHHCTIEVSGGPTVQLFLYRSCMGQSNPAQFQFQFLLVSKYINLPIWSITPVFVHQHQWLDSIPINGGTVYVQYRYSRNPYLYWSNLSLVWLVAVICMAVPIYGYGGQCMQFLHHIVKMLLLLINGCCLIHCRNGGQVEEIFMPHIRISCQIWVYSVRCNVTKRQAETLHTAKAVITIKYDNHIIL